ncbi:hypothetical protein [Thomasclavelia sp.]|uniref:hypothetical protein n=1 Tax=Thomasclavelia sp. TaxID=3025757 RepID=UPI0025F65FC1|nr:hypothetical protein [Thomasclavelia sp.]
MDDVIQRLVDVDRQCVERVKAAKAKKLDIKANMSAKRKEIYDSFVLEQKQKIKEHKEQLVNQNEADAKLLEQSYQDRLVKLEKLYNENKERWVSDIVTRCLK